MTSTHRVWAFGADIDTDQHTSPSSPDTVHQQSIDDVSRGPSIWFKGETPDARSASAARTYPTTVPIEAHLRVPTPIAGVPMQSQACGTEPIAEPSGPLVTPLISTLRSTLDTTIISTLSSTRAPWAWAGRG